jgi:hypothetical protein
MKDETIKQVMQELGRRGGKATTKAKKESSAANLAKARANIKKLKKVDGLGDVADSLDDLLEITVKPRKKRVGKK